MTETEREYAWDKGKIVWEARYGNYRTIIKSNTHVYPNWIHEYGPKVKWKVLEGAEYLTAPHPNQKEEETK